MNTGRSRLGWRTATTLAAVFALAGVLAACGGGSPHASTARSASFATPATSRAPAASPRPAQTQSCVDRVFSNLTQAQRVGQLFLVGLPADQASQAAVAAVRQYHFGSVLLGTDTSEGSAAVAATTARVQSLATKAATGGVRFFVGANQEGGEIQPLTGPGFAEIPSALTQGTWPVSYLRQQAGTWGRELRSAGVNFDLAPVMDVVPAGTASTNAPIGQLDREFGSTPATTGPHGAAFIEGMAAAGVATAAKHFPGLGRVTGNTDFTANVVDSVTTPDDPYLATYRSAITAGVPFVMVALATYTKIDAARLAVFSPVVMRLLRSGMGFRGVIMSDDLGQAAAVASMPAGERATDFLAAGGDLITSQVLPAAEQMASAVLARASADASFRGQVNAAVRLILTAKQAYGLLPC